jgi:hypothetical protein
MRRYREVADIDVGGAEVRFSMVEVRISIQMPFKVVVRLLRFEG